MKKKRKLSKIRLNPENPNNQNNIFRSKYLDSRIPYPIMEYEIR